MAFQKGRGGAKKAGQSPKGGGKLGSRKGGEGFRSRDEARGPKGKGEGFRSGQWDGFGGRQGRGEGARGEGLRGRKDSLGRKGSLEPRAKGPLEAAEENPYLRIGRNPVMEALKAGSSINKMLVARGSREGSIREIIGLARDLGVVIQEVERSHLDELTGGKAHQGIVAYVAPKEYVEIDDILALAKERGEDPFVLILDEVEDPHNLGSLLRSAEGAGAHGVIIPKRRSVSLTETVAKASAGAIEYVPVARVSSLVAAIKELKEKGLWICGADGDAEDLYTERDLKGPLALVIGGEGKGLGRLVKERCDFLVRLPMRGSITSLNASVAGAILLYEALRQRDAAKQG